MTYTTLALVLFWYAAHCLQQNSISISKRGGPVVFGGMGCSMVAGAMICVATILLLISWSTMFKMKQGFTRIATRAVEVLVFLAASLFLVGVIVGSLYPSG